MGTYASTTRFRPDRVRDRAVPSRRRVRKNADPPSKNRVWDFFETSPDRVGFSASQPFETASDTSAVFSETASGLPFWPSRDPIGEWGGLNLYGFVRNNTTSATDAFGLAITEDLDDLGLTVLPDNIYTRVASRFRGIRPGEMGAFTTATTRSIAVWTSEPGRWFRRRVSMSFGGERNVTVTGTYDSSNPCSCKFDVENLYMRVISYRPQTVEGAPGVASLHEAGHREQYMTVARRYAGELSSSRRCYYTRGQWIFSRPSPQSEESCERKAENLRKHIISQLRNHQKMAARRQDAFTPDLSYSLEDTRQAVRAGNALAESMPMRDWTCDDTL